MTENDFPAYIESVPLISQQTEIRLDAVINGLSFAWGFTTPKAFAQSIIDDTLPADKVQTYNRLVGAVLDEARQERDQERQDRFVADVLDFPSSGFDLDGEDF